MRVFVSVLALAFASPSVAAPPPAPPEYVFEATKILAASGSQDAARVAPLFADDVKAYRNGGLVAAGKAAWLTLRAAKAAHFNGDVAGLSQGWASSGQGGGDLLVIDTYDSVDRTDLPPHFLADPRVVTRSTLYQFGQDGLIHAVRIAEVAGFLETPKP